MKMMLIDPRIRFITVRCADLSELVRLEAKVGSDYRTRSEIKNYFGFSNKQLAKYLDRVEAEPVGSLKEIAGTNSKNSRMHLYDRSVIDAIACLLNNEVDIGAIKCMARKVLDEYYHKRNA